MKVGTKVLVEITYGGVSEEFQGTIVSLGNVLKVQDGEGDIWNCEESQLTVIKEENLDFL